MVLLVTLCGLEAAFRLILFSNFKFGDAIRRPGLYFDYFGDDRYWALNYFLNYDGRSSPDPNTHPLLGWTQVIDPVTYLHNESASALGKRPVLFYGDSFGHCVTRRCFQHFFNEDPAFSRRCRMLNYSHGAYGLDQIELMAAKSVTQHPHPFVIFSFLTHDMDRAAAAAYVGPKPYYELENGELVLRGVPLPRNPGDYFQAQPGLTPSYLYRFLTRKIKGLNGFSVSPHARARISNISQAILRKAIRELRDAHADFVFMVFVPSWEGSGSDLLMDDRDDWRLKAAVEIFKSEGVPYLIAKGGLKERIQHGTPRTDLFVSSGPDIGHLNDLGNKIVWNELRATLLEKLGNSCSEAATKAQPKAATD